MLWGPDIGFASCDLRVLMDQSTEANSLHDPPRRRQDNWHAESEWRRLPQGAMRAMAVVVIGVLGQHRPQLPAAQDQDPVQHLPPNRAHPPLRVRIRPRRPHRRGEHLDRLGGEDGVEGGGELRVPIADQKPELAGAVVKGHEQIAGLLRHPLPIGCAVTPSTWTRREATSITNSKYSRCRNTVSTVKRLFVTNRGSALAVLRFSESAR
jgi:hypothetical protein